MAPETQEQQNGSTGETPGQEQQGQQQAPQGETPKPGEQQQAPSTPEVNSETRLPDDHPLVKAYRAQLEENRKLSGAKTEAAEANARAAKVTQLEEELGKRPTTEAMETLQTRYDRLEEFVMAVGLGRALDSRTFTKDLFESDKDITALVKDWNKANPTATSQALSSTAGGQQADGKHDPNELIRIAAGKK